MLKSESYKYAYELKIKMEFGKKKTVKGWRFKDSCLNVWEK